MGRNEKGPVGANLLPGKLPPPLREKLPRSEYHDFMQSYIILSLLITH